MPYFETAHLRRARQRASKRGLPANLYLEEWGRTCQDFGYRCAYCGTDQCSTLDHFIPLTAGVGALASTIASQVAPIQDQNRLSSLVFLQKGYSRF